MAAVSVASNRFLHDEQVLTGALTWGGRVSTWTGRTFGRVSATTGTAAAVDDGAVGPRPRKVVHVDVRASVADGHVLETLRTTVSAAEDGPTSGGQDLVEGFTKFQVEDGVDDGVERTVGVAEPGQHFEDDGRDARLAESGHDVDAEEGNPADEENAHDDTERNGRLVIGDVIGRRMATRVAHFGVVDGQVVGLTFEAAERDGSRRGLNVLHVHLGIEEEARVNGQHDDTRKVERNARRHHCVRGCQVERALRKLIS